MAKIETDPPTGYIVLETFAVYEGAALVSYQKGRTVEPGHPALRKYPTKFGPLTFDYTAPARAIAKPEVRAITKPEIRAD